MVSLLYPTEPAMATPPKIAIEKPPVYGALKAPKNVFAIDKTWTDAQRKLGGRLQTQAAVPGMELGIAPMWGAPPPKPTRANLVSTISGNNRGWVDHGGSGSQGSGNYSGSGRGGSYSGYGGNGYGSRDHDSWGGLR